jgi:phage baseplate assembly protein W
MTDERSFLGTGWGFPPSFSRGSGGVAMTSNEEDIRASLAILLSTRVGERVMQPKYGCNLERLLFQPLDTGLQAYMQDLIRTAILYFEPRIILDKIHLELFQNEGRVDIELDYRVAATNTRYNFVYPFYLEEGSEVPK